MFSYKKQCGKKNRKIKAIIDVLINCCEQWSFTRFIISTRDSINSNNKKLKKIENKNKRERLSIYLVGGIELGN